MPHEDAALRALPGVGPYTARAVRAFAYGDDVAAVDTNGVRVLARGVAGAPLTVRQATALGDQLVPAGASWEFNQAMFDLGATVCTATRPDCARCPLRRQCAWRRQGSRRCRPVAPEPDGAAAEHLRGLGPPGEGAPARRAAPRAACGRATWPAPAAGPRTGPGPTRVAAALVAEGFAGWSGGKDPVLRLHERRADEAGTAGVGALRRRSGT